jgi:prepilin-type processing-associated H-X9-DG protein
MTKVSNPSSTYSPSGGDRVFADTKGRLWSAAHAGEVIIFTCICDGRHSGRAIVVNLAKLDGSVGDDALRAWLDAAPRIGTLP